MTDATTGNNVLLTAAKNDCQKRTEHARKLEDLKQLISCFFISIALLMVGLQSGYPELFCDSVEAGAKANAYVNAEKENNIANANETQNEEMISQATEIQPETEPYNEPITDAVTYEENIENEDTSELVTTSSYSLSDAEIDMLVQAVQHETGANPSFYPNGDYDVIQQYMAASIINRIGQPGFGDGYTTPNSLYEVLANPVQYGSMVWELDWYDANDTRTRNNVMAVLNRYAYTPENLYFERCSEVGEEYWSAQDSFYSQYGYNSSISICYMSLTQEGRYIIFATNPAGAYAF